MDLGCAGSLNTASNYQDAPIRIAAPSRFRRGDRRNVDRLAPTGFEFGVESVGDLIRQRAGRNDLPQA
jgi:hypothetical protein